MEALVELLMRHGVPLVFAATLAARIGAPVPAAPLLVVAGGLASGGQLSLPALFAAALLANVIGDAAWFAAGRRHGQHMMRLLCRISLSPDSCVRQSEALILRWGGSSLVAAKFVPGVSVVAAPMAGALQMSWRTFFGYEAVAALTWSGLYLGLGWLFSRQIQRILDLLAGAGTFALVALLLALAALVGWRYWRRRRVLRTLDMPRIGVDELRELLRAGSAPAIVDVRSTASLQVDPRRLPGALHMPLEELEALAGRIAHERDVVTYCNCPNDVSAVHAAQLLVRRGIARVRPLAGGLDAWFAEVAAPPLPEAVDASSSR